VSRQDSRQPAAPDGQGPRAEVQGRQGRQDQPQRSRHRQDRGHGEPKALL